MKLKIYIFCLFSFTCFLKAYSQEVRNISAEQKGQTILISYDLESEYPCKIELYYSIDNEQTWLGPLQKVSGDVGEGVDNGKHEIIWNVLEEIEEFKSENVKFKIATYLQDPNLISPEELNSYKTRIRIKKIKQLELNAAFYLKNSNYDLAIDQYNAILKLDANNIDALEKIKQIQSTKNILNKRRSTIFKYSNINEVNYSQFQNNLLKEINNQIDETNQGYLNLNYVVAFDTTGKNNSYLKNVTTSLGKFNSVFDNLQQSGVLKSSVEGGFYLASTDTLKYDINWTTIRQNYISSRNSSVIKLKNIQVPISIDKLSAFENYGYGKMSCEVKEKVFNSQKFTDISIVNYKSVGPEAVLYSLLLPGTGSIKVTYGKKGWGRFTTFLLSSGIAISSKMYSNKQYKSYESATSQVELSNYYEKANNSHKLFLIASSISASIYIYDLIWVISKGVHNKRTYKVINNQLKNGPINIRYQPILLP